MLSNLIKQQYTGAYDFFLLFAKSASPSSYPFSTYPGGGTDHFGNTRVFPCIPDSQHGSLPSPFTAKHSPQVPFESSCFSLHRSVQERNEPPEGLDLSALLCLFNGLRNRFDSFFLSDHLFMKFFFRPKDFSGFTFRKSFTGILVQSDIPYLLQNFHFTARFCVYFYALLFSVFSICSPPLPFSSC